MAMTATITQSAPAQFGSPNNFVVAIANSGGAQVSLYALQLVVRQPNGQPAQGVNVGVVYPPPGLSGAQVGGYQFNVPISASGTVYFGVQVVFYGPAITGGLAQPQTTFVLDVNCQASDGTVFTASSPLNVPLNAPGFGQGAGSPPNAAPVIGQLGFANPANSNLAL